MKVFLDIYLALNFGDDLFLDIILKRYSNVKFIVNYTGDLYDDLFKKYKNVEKRKYNVLHKILRRASIYNHLENYDILAEECDCAVFIGGSIFRDENYHKSLYAERMKILNVFLKNKKPTYVIGSNFGPALTENFYKDYYNFFKKCKDVCFRDEYSANLFKNLKNVRKASDIVFSLDNKILKKNKLEKEKKIGYSVIDFNHKQGLENYSEEYLSEIVKSIESFIDKNYECELLSFCEIEGDIGVIENILKKVKVKYKSKIKIYYYNGDIDKIIQKISSYELFFASRFHGNILGLLLETKLVPIIYNQKTLNLLNDLKFNELIIHHNNLSLLSKIDMKNNKFSLSRNIINDAENQFLVLDKELGRGKDEKNFICN